MESNQQDFDWNEFFCAHPLFGELSSDHINSLLDPDNSTHRVYKQGDVIFRAGEISNSFFLIGEGSVNVELTSDDSSATNIGTLYKGDYFGEMSAIDNHNGRAATISANEECVLLEIKSKPFQQALKASPELEFKLLSMLADRLRHVNDHLLKSTRLTYETKFSILSEKIESQSKVVEASLNASQAVFEQTKIRTSEIINAAERGRSRITWVMSTLTAGFTLLLALFSFLGYDKLESAEEMLAEIEGTFADIEETRSSIEKKKIQVDLLVDSTQKGIDDLTATIKTLEENTLEAKRILFSSLIANFLIQIEEMIAGNASLDPGKLGGQILELKDDQVTIELFSKLFYKIDTWHNDRLGNSTPHENNLNRDKILYSTSFMYLYINDAIGADEYALAHYMSNLVLLVTYAMDDEYAKDNDSYSIQVFTKYQNDNFAKRLNEIERKHLDNYSVQTKKQLSRFISELKDMDLTKNGRPNDRKNKLDDFLRSVEAKS